MLKSADQLSFLLKNACGGNEFSARLREIVYQAFSVIRAASHRGAARRARGSRQIDLVRRLVKQNPDWHTILTLTERKIILLKFGLEKVDGDGRDDDSVAAVISNTETGLKLNITKQMVAYHLRSIAKKLETAFGKQPPEAKQKDNFQPVGNLDAGLNLMHDDAWQNLVRWWRIRSSVAITDDSISIDDIRHLKELMTRLDKIIDINSPSVSAAAKNKIDIKKKKRGRRSPQSFHDLRTRLLKNSVLLDYLTGRQREVLTIGLGLKDKKLSAETELGFRRFHPTGAMTKQNFYSIISSAENRLKEYF